LTQDQGVCAPESGTHDETDECADDEDPDEQTTHDGGPDLDRRRWDGVVPSMFITLTSPSHGRIVRGRGCPLTRKGMTTGGRRCMRCTLRSWWTGGWRSCAVARDSRCSTSRRSSRNAGWPRTCTFRCVVRSRGR